MNRTVPKRRSITLQGLSSSSSSWLVEWYRRFGIGAGWRGGSLEGLGGRSCQAIGRVIGVGNDMEHFITVTSITVGIIVFKHLQASCIRHYVLFCEVAAHLQSRDRLIYLTNQQHKPQLNSAPSQAALCILRDLAPCRANGKPSLYPSSVPAAGLLFISLETTYEIVRSHHTPALDHCRAPRPDH